MQRVWRDYLQAFKGFLALAIGCAVMVAISTQFVIWCLKPGIELLFGESDSAAASEVPPFVAAHPLIWVPVVMIAATIVRLIAQLGLATSVNKVGHRLVGRIQSQLFGNLIHADLGHLNKAHSGSYLSSVLFDAGLMREATTNGVVNYVQHTGIVVAALVSMAQIDWRMTLGVLLIGPVIGAVLGQYNRRTKKAAQGAMDETSTLSTAIMESLDGVKIVKINNREAYEQARVDAVIERRQKHIIKGANARASAAPMTEALTTIVLALVVAYAGWRAQSGAMTLGGFTAYIAFLGAAGQSLRQLANLQTVMAEGFTAARRLFAALDVAPEITDAPDAKPLGAFDRVTFDRVSFAYGDAPVLRDISFEARAGQSVALVGPSGSGKSTLLNLLPRFYDAVSGDIRFGDTPQRAVTLSSLRERIALVSQDPFLFDDTIRANIAYGRPGASDAAISQAVRDAAAEDFIADLAQGLDTRVGEGGSRLSGGQKQRIAIARAFLKDAPLLLLDEATSALDTQSEIKVQQALERLMAGRTTFIIAHRLSTVRHADQILVLKDGEIVERGTHDQLLIQNGLYADLAQTQFTHAASEVA
ncbi:ABC transporter ATP-binding protein [Asticcacaulis sp. YBE204]|uniref:ABC transporter ATP-binding protein n=1 Tax=Asticcacaulis sp. YBE204 TaxID=1282363 RepID=UPI0003C3DBBC|nr:ABC transporter ATP-binding protein [Asticcacaulis sp. YBE204]ESQ77984.1 multidrug ABC transporter permease [Asticcacaulis sp. YBE204]